MDTTDNTQNTADTVANDIIVWEEMINKLATLEEELMNTIGNELSMSI